MDISKLSLAELHEKKNELQDTSAKIYDEILRREVSARMQKVFDACKTFEHINQQVEQSRLHYNRNARDLIDDVLSTLNRLTDDLAQQLDEHGKPTHPPS